MNRKGAREFVIYDLACVNVGVKDDYNGESTVPLPLSKEINSSIRSAASHEELLGQAFLIHLGPFVGLHIKSKSSPSYGVQSTVQRCDAEVIPGREETLNENQQKDLAPEIFSVTLVLISRVLFKQRTTKVSVGHAFWISPVQLLLGAGTTLEPFFSCQVPENYFLPWKRGE